MTPDEFFKEATLRICGSLEIEHAMYACFRTLQKVMPVDRIHLEMLKPEMKAILILASVSEKHTRKEHTLVPGFAKLEEMANLVLIERKDKVIIFDDRLEKWDLILDWFGKYVDFEMKSAMDLALQYEGEYKGALTLFSEKDRFTSDHAELLEMLQKPFEISLANYLKFQEVTHLKDLLADDNRYLHSELHHKYGNEIIGADYGLKNVTKQIRMVAPSESPVLLLGETGVGKDVIANTIHHSSTRQGRPFISVNCGAIPESLLDSELFGHEKGAFTGALSRKRGRFERADNGTIFLDEIGELPPAAQVRLLRVLQHREIERVGGTQTIPVNIRIIAATNRNLEEMIQKQLFREDLWFRLNVFPIIIPPLRERRMDIPSLLDHFISIKAKELKLTKIPTMEPGVVETLTAYRWPGNVRELQNIVERELIINPSGPLSFASFIKTSRLESANQLPPAGIATDNLDAVNAHHIKQVLDKTGGRINGQGGAAELLGLKPNTLRHRMSKLGIAFGRKAKS